MHARMLGCCLSLYFPYLFSLVTASHVLMNVTPLCTVNIMQHGKYYVIDYFVLRNLFGVDFYRTKSFLTLPVTDIMINSDDDVKCG